MNKYPCFLRTLISSILMMGVFLPFASVAEDEQGNMSYSIGYYDIRDNNEAVDFRLEYRSGKSILLENLKPWVGIELTSEATAWIGTGMLYDWEFTDSWHFIPSVGVGLYDEGSSDLDLGHTVEFRSQLEIAKELDQENLLGLSFSHLSNGGMDNTNPGVEVLNLYWHKKF